MVLRERSYDYQFRYCGHCNTTTDIKEANFFGRSEALDRRRVHIIIGSRSWWGGATREATLCGHSLPGSASVPLGTSAGLCFLIYSVRPAGSHDDLSTAASAVPGAVPSTLPTLPNVPELAWTLRAFFATERGSENYERLGTSDHCAQDRALGSEGQSLSS